MTRLLLVRHGESEWNALGRWQGWADSPLSAAGLEQAARAATQLDGRFTAVLTSDLLRAAQTADVIAARLKLGAAVRERGFREIDVGLWSGLTHAEIDARFPGAIESWRAGERERPHGGESRADFQSRILAAIERVRLAYPTSDVVVCTHAGVIRQIERHLDAFVDAPVGNLHARWFEADAAGLRALERVALDGTPAP